VAGSAFAAFGGIAALGDGQGQGTGVSVSAALDPVQVVLLQIHQVAQQTEGRG